MFNDEVMKICEVKIGNSEKAGKIGEIINIYPDGIGVKCLDGEIIITRLKPSGKKEMSARDYLNGLKRNIIGEIIC